MPELLVAFDGGCPACRREIGHYQRLHPREPVVFLDLQTAALPAGAPARERLMARFHVQTPEGGWLDGAAAFVRLWQVLPGWRWAARLARLPGALTLLEAGYAGFLRLRPLWRRQPAACALPK